MTVHFFAKRSWVFSTNAICGLVGQPLWGHAKTSFLKFFTNLNSYSFGQLFTQKRNPTFTICTFWMIDHFGNKFLRVTDLWVDSTNVKAAMEKHRLDIIYHCHLGTSSQTPSANSTFEIHSSCHTNFKIWFSISYVCFHSNSLCRKFVKSWFFSFSTVIVSTV